MKQIIIFLMLMAISVCCRQNPIAPLEKEEEQISQDRFVEEAEAVLESRLDVFLKEYKPQRAMFGEQYDYNVLLASLKDGMVPFEENIAPHKQCGNYMRSKKAFKLKTSAGEGEYFLVLKECGEISWEPTARVKNLLLQKVSTKEAPFKTHGQGGFFNIYWKVLP